VDVALTIDESARSLPADERLMSVALTGAVGAMLALAAGTSGATVEVRVSTHPATRFVSFYVAQDAVPAPAARVSALADAAQTDWVGDQRVSVGLSVARRVAQLHGGRLDVGPAPRGSGCAVTLLLPAGD
jgi:hypothetical protein